LEKTVTETKGLKHASKGADVMDPRHNGRGPIDRAAAEVAFVRATGGRQEAFGDFFLARLFGFEITHPADVCEVKFPIHDFLFNPQGTVHGGVLATALDVAMGHLLHRLAGAGATLEFKVQFLAPVRQGFVICRSDVLRRGSSIWFLRAEARDGAGDLIAHATSTWKLRSAISLDACKTVGATNAV
jgi:uncharacterized protein (TIGR00369 family)